MTYTVLQMVSGQMIIVRDLKKEGNKPEDVYMIILSGASGRNAGFAISRMDSSSIMEGATNFKINMDTVSISYELGPDAPLVKQLDDVDTKTRAAKSGLVMPDANTKS